MRASRSAATDSDLVGTMREGVLAQKHLLWGEDGSPNNYDLNMGKTGKGGWRAPRHRHNFDQIRYVIAGEYPYGENQVMPTGWVGYFPESVFYGPQDRPEGLETMVLQFGGASGQGYLSVERREAANAALNEKGEFKKGMFIYEDDAGKEQVVDGSEACFEHATGEKLRFARPRYDDVIAMDPSAYEWLPQGAQGVEVKWMGSFTERGARIGFIRLEKDAVYSAGQHPSMEILFQAAGRVVVAEEEYGKHSGFEFMPNEGPIAVRALESTLFLCMVQHQF